MGDDEEEDEDEEEEEKAAAGEGEVGSGCCCWCCDAARTLLRLMSPSFCSSFSCCEASC